MNDEDETGLGVCLVKKMEALCGGVRSGRCPEQVSCLLLIFFDFSYLIVVFYSIQHHNWARWYADDHGRVCEISQRRKVLFFLFSFFQPKKKQPHKKKK